MATANAGCDETVGDLRADVVAGHGFHQRAEHDVGGVRARRAAIIYFGHSRAELFPGAVLMRFVASVSDEESDLLRTDVLRLVARPVTDPSDILWLAPDEPLAFSMAGRPGTVVATEALARHLTPAAVAAVLAHERAHLAGRHHLLVAIPDTARGRLVGCAEPFRVA